MLKYAPKDKTSREGKLASNGQNKMIQIFSNKNIRLLQETLKLFSQGKISPLPIHEFGAPEVEQAFRYMQKGTHIGKVIVTIPDSAESIPASPSVRSPSFSSDCCHIIVGGLGGLGRAVSSWMVMHGARHLVFFSRSAGKTSDKDHFVQELRAQNCVVDLVSGDITKSEDVDSLIENINRPIAGIMQASMVLKVRTAIYRHIQGFKLLTTGNRMLRLPK